MSERIVRKLARLSTPKIICYLRGYDAQWHCLSQVPYLSSARAESDCTELNRNPMSELNYHVECEVIK